MSFTAKEYIRSSLWGSKPLINPNRPKVGAIAQGGDPHTTVTLEIWRLVS
jgi:hypothetical protein